MIWDKATRAPVVIVLAVSNTATAFCFFSGAASSDPVPAVSVAAFSAPVPAISGGTASAPLSHAQHGSNSWCASPPVSTWRFMALSNPSITVIINQALQFWANS